MHKRDIFHEKLPFGIHQEYCSFIEMNYCFCLHNYKYIYLYIYSEDVRFDKDWPEFADINGLFFISLEVIYENEIHHSELIVFKSVFKDSKLFPKDYFWKATI